VIKKERNLRGSQRKKKGCRVIGDLVKKIKEYKNMNADYTNIIVTKDTPFNKSSYTSYKNSSGC